PIVYIVDELTSIILLSLTSCLSTPRRRQKATLFPYTTLFRSNGTRIDIKACVAGDLIFFKYPTTGERDDQVVNHVEIVVGVTGKDRKSTRLNSSHVKISYAVFCLKKKSNPSGAARYRRCCGAC